MAFLPIETITIAGICRILNNINVIIVKFNMTHIRYLTSTGHNDMILSMYKDYNRYKKWYKILYLRGLK